MEFGLLGPLTVRCGETMLGISRGKQRVLLAALLVRAGHIVPVDELTELIWAGRPPSSARVTLLNHVKRLRQALGQPGQALIKRSGPGYIIDPAPGELDLTRFGALCAAGREALRQCHWKHASSQLTAALSLWRGQPFLDIACAPLTASELPRLTELRLSALEDRIDAELHLGRHDAVITELRQHVISEPMRERGHALLTLALYRAGRQADALAAYQAARRELVRELGLEPGAELRRLHQQILAADPDLDLRPAATAGSTVIRPNPATDPVPRQLPHAPRCFVGRQRELDALTRRLDAFGQPGTVAISVIAGGAGVGKTALATHWAHQMADRFPDGQLYADLHGFGDDDSVRPADAVRGFLDALHVPAARISASPAERVGLYRSLLASRRMLLLLDNAADAGQVRPLLPAGPGCAVVITSRSRLTGLAVTEGAHLVSLDTLTEAEGRELLASRLEARRLADEAHASADLIRLCAGLPLALAIAAGRIASDPGLRIATVARELGDARSPLRALDTSDAATSARSVFSWSFRKLSAPAADVFRLIGEDRGQDITLSAIAARAGIPESRASRLLTELTEASLATEHTPDRFTVHPLMRAYAAEAAEQALESRDHLGALAAG
jgi:DNA-binding SARP family transcriptional activator/AraC-like DNA-binding protein